MSQSLPPCPECSSTYAYQVDALLVCPECGHEAHIFGDGGVRREAERLDLPFLGELPISVEVRLAGDGGVPVAATDSPVADAYRRMARRLMERCAG